MRIFVAGAGGYIGIPLCELLAKNGHDVIAFDRYFFGKTPDRCNGRVITSIGDTRDVAAIDLKGCDAVIDLAGLSNDASCEIDTVHTKNINVDGALNLIQRAMEAHVPHYVYSSSASVYGHGEKHNLTEECPIHPLTEYACSKRWVEQFLEDECGQWLKYVILRNATVFGYAPRMRFDLAVNVMTARAHTEGSIYVMGGGDQWRPFVHVGDVARVLAWAAQEAGRDEIAGQTFNVGIETNQMTVRALANRVAMIYPGVKIHMIPDDADNRTYHLSFSKLRKVNKMVWNSVDNGIWEVRQALQNGQTAFDDPATKTVNWYKSMLEWNARIETMKCNGRLL